MEYKFDVSEAMIEKNEIPKFKKYTAGEIKTDSDLIDLFSSFCRNNHL